MNCSKDYYLLFLNKINDFVWEPFDEVFSRSSIFYRMNVRTSLYKVQSCSDVQKEIMPQPLPLIFIPGIGLF